MLALQTTHCPDFIGRPPSLKKEGRQWRHFEHQIAFHQNMRMIARLPSFFKEGPGVVCWENPLPTPQTKRASNGAQEKYEFPLLPSLALLLALRRLR
jgi:hypothetical protein